MKYPNGDIFTLNIDSVQWMLCWWRQQICCRHHSAHDFLDYIRRLCSLARGYRCTNFDRSEGRPHRNSACKCIAQFTAQ